MSEPEVSWSALDGFAVVIGAFVIYIVGSVVLASVDVGIEGRHHLGFWLIPASYAFLTAGTFFMVQMWLIVRRGATWSMVGFRIPVVGSVGRSIGWIVLVAVIAYLITDIGAAIIIGVFSHTSFHIKSNVKELLPSGSSSVTAIQFVVLLVMGAVLAPLTEETLFRGVLYQGIRRVGSIAGRGAGIAFGAIVAGTVFGVFHLIGGTGEIYTLPILVFLGILLCLTFQATGSLAGSVLLHAMVNGVSIVLYYGALIH